MAKGSGLEAGLAFAEKGEPDVVLRPRSESDWRSRIGGRIGLGPRDDGAAYRGVAPAVVGDPFPGNRGGRP